MRRTASSHASPARHRVRIPGALKADPSGTMVRRTVRWMGEAAVAAAAAATAAAEQSYKHKVRGKTRPDSCQRPTGPSLMSEKECKDPRPFLNPSHSLSFPSSSPLTLLTAIIPKQGDIFLFVFGIDNNNDVRRILAKMLSFIKSKLSWSLHSMAASPWTEDRGKGHPSLLKKSQTLPGDLGKCAKPRKCKDCQLQHNKKAHGRHQYQQITSYFYFLLFFFFIFWVVRIFRSSNTPWVPTQKAGCSFFIFTTVVDKCSQLEESKEAFQIKAGFIKWLFCFCLWTISASTIKDWRR